MVSIKFCYMRFLGDRTDFGLSIKFFTILVCFLVAFMLNVQSIRYYNYASILINVPFKKLSTSAWHQMLTAEYVATTVNMGSYFWSLGLQAFYFSFALFMWIFGPIPMLLSCFVLVFILYFLGVTFQPGWAGVADNNSSDDDDENEVVHNNNNNKHHQHHHVDVKIGSAN